MAERNRKNRNPLQPGVADRKVAGKKVQVPPERILTHLRDVVLVIKKDLRIAWASPFSFW